MDDLSHIAQQRALTRRDFLRSGMAAASGPALLGFSPLRAAKLSAGRKTVVVTFGGGARDEETFAPEGQRNIPHLMQELIPQATFCTQVVNRGILGHYVATASLATGVYESFNNFAAVAPQNPTVFEYYRKQLRRPATDTWVIAPSNGFQGIGESDGSSFASGFGAQVVLPKQLLRSAMQLRAPGAPDHAGSSFLLQDNYEDPLFTPPLATTETTLAQMNDLLKLSVADFTQHALSLTSPDELSVFIMRHVMRRFAPSLLWITLHDMDVAHTGAYSLYLDGIRSTDRLCSEIWAMIEGDPEYKGRTTMLILPDFGRDSDFEASGNGFQHHRTGDPLSRTTWLMALGPHVRENLTVDRPISSLDLVPTLGALMGFQTPLAQGRPVMEIL